MNARKGGRQTNENYFLSHSGQGVGHYRTTPTGKAGRKKNYRTTNRMPKAADYVLTATAGSYYRTNRMPKGAD